MRHASEHRLVLAIIAALSVANAAATLGQPLLVQYALDHSADKRMFLWNALLLLGLFVASLVIGTIKYFLLQMTAERIVRSSRRSLVKAVLCAQIARLQNYQLGDITSRVTADTTALKNALTTGLMECVGGIALLIGALIAMFSIDRVLAIVGVTAILILVGLAFTAVNRIRVTSNESQRALGALTGRIINIVSGVLTIRAASATRHATRQLTDCVDDVYSAAIRNASATALLETARKISNQGALLITLGVGGIRVASGDLTLSQFITFILFFHIFAVPFDDGISAIKSVSNALGAIDRTDEIVRLPSEAEHPPSANSSRDAFDDRMPIMAMRGVAFSYGSVARPTIEIDRLEFRNQSLTAVVGPSGSGKSTLLMLLERFYEPCRGVIEWYGVDVRDLLHTDLRSRIGFVEQNVPVFEGSVRDNLTLGRSGVSDEDCLLALSRVNLQSRFGPTSGGLNTNVGDRGLALSGGERQRLALARVLVWDPELLILDEPTSSVDAENDRILGEILSDLARTRSVIVVTHRLSLVQRADAIVVVNCGVVEAVGTHQSLLDDSDTYRRHVLALD